MLIVWCGFQKTSSDMVQNKKFLLLFQ